MTTQRSEVEPGHSVFTLRCDVDAFLEQKVDDASPAEFAAPHKSRLQLGVCCIRLQRYSADRWLFPACQLSSKWRFARSRSHGIRGWDRPDLWRCGPTLIRAPVEWSEVAIVVPARVIPIEAECVEMTRRRFRERQTWIGRMQSIVDVQRLRRIRDARHSLTTLFEHFRNRYRTQESVFLDLNGSRF